MNQVDASSILVGHLGGYYVGSKKRCVIHQCSEPPYAIYTWGSDKLETQTHPLCKEHGTELWEMLNPLLKANMAWLSMEPP